MIAKTISRRGVIVFCIAKILLFGAAGLFNAVMDKLHFHYSTSVFPQNQNERFLGGTEQFWNPELSWRNKYEDFPEDSRPAFLFATTALVFLTDGWHLFQFLMLTCFAAACVPPVSRWWHWLAWFAVLRIAFSLVFTLGFDILLDIPTR